ncbi:MAG TPA: NapC/NirT family cytochrome c [Vicinamibacterales bacterium]|nr:NapC/NirT family cytochrome c [Vicinamibacterales bacterium]
MWRVPLPRNPISLAGSVLAVLGGALFIVVFVLDLMGLHTNPYMGILFFMVFPAVFILGLLLIPVGMWRDRVRRRDGRTEVHWPKIDLGNPRHRAWTFFIAVATVVNLVVVSLAAYSGVHYMDSVEFCGQVCHEVMQPEFEAYQDGPHSRVTCVKCHIGDGASWFVRSKLSGARQVFAVAFGTFSRPIPSPVHNLRPARETCEQCHWPEKFHGDKIRVLREYGEDEANTETQTILQIHVGGGSDSLGVGAGIHWHMNVANTIEYIATDDKRQVIPWVRMTDRDGHVREYVVEGVTPQELAAGERRTLDCVDCHNRPSHPFDATASRAVDRAISRGEIAASLPYIKREATAVIQGEYPSHAAATDAIAARLRAFYREQYNEVYMGRRQEVERAVLVTQRLYQRNVFPSMNVTFGSYPNNIGHMDFPGCFRCHDESHRTTDGLTIRQDCELCHKFQ